MSADIFPCRHCAYPLGLCNEAELMIAKVSFFEKVTMKCPRCGRMNYWRPALKIHLHKSNNRVKTFTA